MHITIKVDLYLRWPATENLKNCETVKGGLKPSKNKFTAQKTLS